MALEPEGEAALRLMSDIANEEKHDADEHSKLVLDAMRRLADDQLDRAERVRNSARNTFLYVSALFTVGQTVAISALGNKSLSHGDRNWIIFLGVGAAVALASVGVLTVAVDRLRKVASPSADDIERQADAAIENDEFVADRFAKLYRATAIKRSKAVDERTRWLNWHTVASLIVIMLVVVELVVSLISRVA